MYTPGYRLIGVDSNRVDVMRPIVKVRILTGTYLLPVHRKKFRMDGVTDASCPLCYLEDEDIVHMLIPCPALSEVRIADFMGLPYFSGFPSGLK